MPGLSTGRTRELEHCGGDWPVLIHLGKVIVIKTAVSKVLLGKYDQDDNYESYPETADFCCHSAAQLQPHPVQC